MVKMKKWRLEKEYVQVPNETAVAVEVRESEPETCISLQALGLIVNLWSYNTEEWELHKTELYKRFGKNKEVSVKSSWKELMDANYIIEYKFRIGNKWEYEYYYRITPFTAKEREEILTYAEKEHGQIWGLDFQDLKMKTSKPRDNKYIINKKQINKKEEEDIPNASLSVEIHNQRSTIVKSKEEKDHTPSLSDDDLLAITQKVQEMFKGHIHKRSFDSVLKKCMNNYKKGTVPLYENYLISAIEQKIEEVELRKKRKQYVLNPLPKTKKTMRKEMVPSWLKENNTNEQDVNIEDKTKLEEDRKRLKEELQKYKRD
ncbi:hypothetical protein COC69_15880 [Bacillus cereus]|uniref:Uncharacterized protein n=1 Tax=Bacillus cereus TaxID=1396 RepID=A0A9X7GVK6_BACCE|nr:hypothetical protein [Bacillus cereus]PGS78289.1 hypothetical protein COC69_15880 [Bacillus cereus]